MFVVIFACSNYLVFYLSYTRSTLAAGPAENVPCIASSRFRRRAAFFRSIRACLSPATWHLNADGERGCCDATASNAASVSRMSSLWRARRAARPLFGDWCGAGGGAGGAAGADAPPVMRRASDTPATDRHAGAALCLPRAFSRCSRFRRADGSRCVDAVS